MLAGKSSNKKWEETRTIQNIFFNFIHDLVSGFKELKLHTPKRKEFTEEIKDSCREYKDKRVAGDMNFANVYIMGELLFTIVIGVVVFLFPVLFKDMENQSLSSFVLVFLYMTGPVHGVMNSIPQLLQIRISWKRLNQLEAKLKAAIEEDMSQESKVQEYPDQLKLECNNLSYAYSLDHEESFGLGPLSLTIQSGQITFVTGGNGSGKSTLARLLTGLVSPDDGDIKLNGQFVSGNDISQLFSVVFNDYHLFRTLYGIDYEAKKDEMAHLLQELKIDDKVQIENGRFSTMKLSAGQRKRMALLISYLEDRPFFLFDEWAAEQDPGFREFFYHTLLPELKQKGKGVIAVTHDDRYFKLADQLIKMEEGRIVATMWNDNQSNDDSHNSDVSLLGRI
ncbi:ABC transporter ATP-binding protein YojI [compost metagenome]